MRPPVRYTAIALVALAAIFVAARAAMFSASFALTGADPATALSLDADNPEAIIRRAELLAQAAGGGGDTTTVDGDDLFAAARDSIAILPLNAPAFRLFASTSASSEQQDRFEAQVAMSDRLSRRDLATQLFMIESSVEDDDIAAALYHYDNAMRIRESSRTLLLPVLSAAIEAPAIRAHLRPYFERETPWLGEFIRQAIATTPDPADAAALLIEAGGMPEGTFYEALHGPLLSRLVTENRMGPAIRYYRSLDGADPKVLTSLAMTEASTASLYTPMTWQLYEIEGLDAMFLVSGSGGYELSATLEPGFAGLVARKVSALSPGSYAVSIGHRAEDVQPGGTLRWQIECQGDGRNERILDREIAMETRFALQADFDVPQWCESQVVTVFAAIGYEPRDTVLTVTSPRLSRR